MFSKHEGKACTAPDQEEETSPDPEQPTAEVSSKEAEVTDVIDDGLAESTI